MIVQLKLDLVFVDDQDIFSKCDWVTTEELPDGWLKEMRDRSIQYFKSMFPNYEPYWISQQKK